MNPLASIVAITLTVFSAGALAHGETAHSGKHPSAQSAEEKPFGKAGDSNKVTRTITVRMNDKMRFEPAHITVKQGETIRLVAKNDGKVMHEMVLGTMPEFKKHSEQMKKMPGMTHDEPYMTHVGPGKTAQIIWEFTKAGVFDYACLVAGHFEAGMTGKVSVTPAK